MNYYEEITLEIKELIANKKYDEAIAKINIELSMPYVPNDFELQLGIFKKTILSELNNIPPKELSMQFISEMLSSSDEEQISIAIFHLSKLNLRNSLDEISKILNLENLEDKFKILILIHLNAQEVNQKFSILYKGASLEIIPTEIDFSNDFAFLMQADKLIDNSIGNDNPGIASNAKILNLTYYLNNFINFKHENLNERAACFIILANEMSEGPTPLSFVKKWFNYNEDIVNDALVEIRNNV